MFIFVPAVPNLLKKSYDNSWRILMLTDNLDYQQMCGSSNGCAYMIKTSRQYKNWKMAVGDFMGFCEANKKEERPIGIQLGDPMDFSDYIMFGGGVTGEIVVNSKQQEKIIMDINAKYLTGARLYFDAKKWLTMDCWSGMVAI